MSERIEKFKFRRELRKIDWNSVIKVTMQTHKKKSEADKVLADKDAEIAELEEERLWRKFPDEKPSEEGYYIICGSSGFRNADKWTYCKDRQNMDFSFYSYGVKYWMPMPSAPREEK